jgi:ribosome-binding protein aMBF1 (putative translation factor)
VREVPALDQAEARCLPPEFPWYNTYIVTKKTSGSKRRPRTPEDGSSGDLLRRAREKAGLTQTELADRLGHTQQAVAQAERAESNPTVSFLHRWARACGRSLSIRLK